MHIRRDDAVRDVLKWLRPQREIENDFAIGGMRSLRLSVQKLPGHQELGKQVRYLVERFLDSNPEIQIRCLQSLGEKDETLYPTDDVVFQARKYVNTYFQLEGSLLVSTSPESTTTAFWIPLNADIFEAWATKANDPAVIIGQWLRGGAPGGINSMPPEDGVFPLSTGEYES